MKHVPQKTGVEKLVEAIGSVPSLIVHTVIFLSVFALSVFGFVDWQIMLLTLTTIISIEAIYLALFIQIAVNKNTAQLREVEEDIEEIQEDVEELGEDVEDIQEDIEEISEDIDEIQEDVEEMSEEEESEGLETPVQTEVREKRERKERKEKDEKEILDELTRTVSKLVSQLEFLQDKK